MRYLYGLILFFLVIAAITASSLHSADKVKVIVSKVYEQGDLIKIYVVNNQLSPIYYNAGCNDFFKVYNSISNKMRLVQLYNICQSKCLRQSIDKISPGERKLVATWDQKEFKKGCTISDQGKQVDEGSYRIKLFYSKANNSKTKYVAYGQVEIKADSCNSNSDCTKEISYCKKENCNIVGRCEFKPKVCKQLENPVCGCDENTYGNECKAAASGVNIKNNSTCDENKDIIIPARFELRVGQSVNVINNNQMMITLESIETPFGKTMESFVNVVVMNPGGCGPNADPRCFGPPASRQEFTLKRGETVSFLGMELTNLDITSTMANFKITQIFIVEGKEVSINDLQNCSRLDNLNCPENYVCYEHISGGNSPAGPLPKRSNGGDKKCHKICVSNSDCGSFAPRCIRQYIDTEDFSESYNLCFS